ncbi:hypothetical protein [Alkalihalobacillus sp. LMS39]|uniref:hypothetical protein n=1 Tax=Alkalihalobacillus sp. LMS39 TaxID=2924032 RepID=UPI001FB306E1|nr:hypothetical protein [Alkalihalobacillus sp. LMS39]UOE93320.1 hypothetical protein MM271_19305 [Alkalihalobacillus sp. LMS39]
MERNKVKKQKITVYGIVIVLALSMYFNFNLYKENNNFKVSKGAAYQDTVSLTLFYLNEGDVDVWIETLQKEENGDVLLERYIGNLNEIANGYRGMSANVQIIDEQIKNIIRQYRELEKNLVEGKDYQVFKEEINKNITFIRTVLEQVILDLEGEDEVLWYKELSDIETKTGNYIWEQYKE